MQKIIKHDGRMSYRVAWPIIFAISAVVIFFFYYRYSSHIEHMPHTNFGLICGIAGATAIAVLFFYWVRKYYFFQKSGTMHSWFVAHIYLAIICIFLVFIHSGFRTSGVFSGITLMLFILVSASGTVGTVLYFIIPLSLSKYGGIMSNEDLSVKSQKYLADADRIAEKASKNFKNMYASQVRPYLSPNFTPWKHLFMEENTVIARCEDKIERLKSRIMPHETYDLQVLGALFIQRERLAFKYVKLNSLKAWLDFHIPLTVGMITAVIIHVISILYF